MTRRWLVPGALCVLALTCAYTAGCSKRETTLYKVTEKQKVSLIPDGTENQVQGGRLGETLTTRHMVFANGETGDATYRSIDGTLKHVEEKYPNGSIKSFADFDIKGKFVAGEVRRPNGTRYMKRADLETGVVRFTYFNNDDKIYKQREIDSADENTVFNTFFRTDGTTIGKVCSFKRDGREVEDWFDVYANGIDTRAFHVQVMAPSPTELSGRGGRLVTFKNQQGSVEFTQLWREGNWTRRGGNLHLEAVDEYNWNGKDIQRTLYFKDEENLVSLIGSKTTENVPTTGSLKAQGTNTNNDRSVMQVMTPNGRMQTVFDPRFGGTFQTGTTFVLKDVLRTYRLGEKEIEDKEVEQWTEDQWNWDPLTGKPSIQKITYFRKFHAGTLEKVVRGTDAPELHTAKENLHPDTGIYVHWISILKTEELDMARQRFWEDLRFLGEPDDQNPCRWYHTQDENN